MTQAAIGRAYGRIPHLPGSAMSSDDIVADRELAELCLSRASRVRIEEKLDGSCVAVWATEDRLVATARSGNPCEESSLVQHRLFAHWAAAHASCFHRVLREGERVVGEWLALAHGTRYELQGEPFVALEIVGRDGVSTPDARERLQRSGFVVPRIVHEGSPIPVSEVVARLEPSGHGALDPVEGAVWKVWPADSSLARAKYVLKGKHVGCYLPENGKPPHWNWRPDDPSVWAAAGGYSGRG